MSEDTNITDNNTEIELPKIEADKLPSQDESQTERSNPADSEEFITSDQYLEPETLSDKPNKMNIYKLLRIFFTLGFIVFTLLFINEMFLQPYRVKQSIEFSQDLYKPNTTVPPTQASIPDITIAPGNTQLPENDVSEKQDKKKPLPPDPNRDDKGRLKQFTELLKVNEDVKGWITIPDSNINYVVMQSSNEDKEYYLTRDIQKQVTKAGSLFLDHKSSIELPTQNLVIHGHNMTSTDNMFHYLMNFKKLDYYKERPVFTFDTIYQTGQWKIFSIFITNGTSNKEPLFNYTRSVFKDSSDYMNFIYQLRIRSIYNLDTVDINENDQILTLSTCSYEVKDYRTVIVARRVRENEEPTVDVENITINEAPLYPGSYYYRYGGKAPEITETFEEALEAGEINWYKAPEAEADNE